MRSTSLVVTILAATSPARAATRVAPLAALRPADAPSIRRGSTGRLVTATLLTLIGFVMLGLGAPFSIQTINGLLRARDLVRGGNQAGDGTRPPATSN